MQNSRQSLWITVRKWHNKLFTYAWGQFHCCKGQTDSSMRSKGFALTRVCFDASITGYFNSKVPQGFCSPFSIIRFIFSADVSLHHQRNQQVESVMFVCKTQIALPPPMRILAKDSFSFLFSFDNAKRKNNNWVQIWWGEKVVSQQTKSKKIFPCFGEVKIRNAAQMRWFHQIHYFFFPFNFTKYYNKYKHIPNISLKFTHR